jgi:hypothetical protein
MAGKNTAVFGIYSTYGLTEGAVNALREAGFRNTDVSVLFPENAGTKDFAHEKGTKAPEGATAGAGTGAVVGGALGWLAGIGALESGHWSRPVLSWRRLRGSVWAEP